jgi:putative transport protein
MREWLQGYANANPVAYSILLISVVAVVGLAFASLRIRGVGIGVSGVLFAGLIFGHFGFHLEHHTLEFLREFGLILFVFTIGLQIGPGFFASLRDRGLVLNGLAAAIVVGGGILTLIFAKIFGIGFGAAAGLLPGRPPTRLRSARPSKPCLPSTQMKPPRGFPRFRTPSLTRSGSRALLSA